jgi:MOSC domain-containing protein YiiM
MSRQGRILQINLSHGGVPKLSCAQGRVDEDGLEGDGHRSRTHGGPEKALCLYSLERILALQSEGHPIFPGSTGENITVSGLEWDRVTPGAVLHLGGTLRIEVTQYTSPCPKIAASFCDAGVERMSQDSHPGWARVYARVLTGGTIRPADIVVLESPGE